jgi:radical SAM superfamily enzyme YgiQ (UPF0313 family)
MPHVALVPFTGVRVREEEMLELGMTLPGLSERRVALARLPSLGLLTLAGLLPPGWSCSYHEGDGNEEELIEQIQGERPDLVALSALSASVEEAYRFSARLRWAGLPVVLGGLHASACSGEVLSYCDAAVVGDGEPVWQTLLADAASGNLKPVYRAARPFNLAESPVPRFDLLGQERHPRLTLQTQRGCPLACDFCGASRLLGPFREKPLQRLRQELDAITALVPRPVLELADDNTFAGPRAAEPLLELLAEHAVRYFTEVDWRIGERPDVLRGLGASGCLQVLVGIESLVFRHSGMGAKQADLPRILDAVQAIQDSGVAVAACFIVGCDGETHESLDRLVAFVQQAPFAEIQLTVQTPFPGTSLYERLRRQGRLLSGRGWSHYTLFDVTYQPEPLSVQELEQAFCRVVRQCFSDQAVTRRKQIRRHTWERNPTFRRAGGHARTDRLRPALADARLSAAPARLYCRCGSVRRIVRHTCA